MTSTAKKVIVAQGHPRGVDEEGTAGAAITPGMAIELQADGKWDPVVSSQAEALKDSSFTIADKNKGEGETVATAYALNDVVYMYHPVKGEVLNVLVKSGENIAVGDRGCVEGGSSGLFVEKAGTETRYQVQFLESSGGALAANTLLRARVL